MHFLLLLFLSVVVSNSKGSVLEVSPCPRIFTYEGETNHPDRWYGILTLLSDTELNGVWIRVIFDKPIIQLGNWFGEAVKRNITDYLIRNPAYKLQPHTPKVVRIFVKYDVNDTPPKLISFRLNGKTVCPEDLITTTPSTTTEHLFTSLEEEANVAPATPVTELVKHPLAHTTASSLYISKHKENLNEICGTVANRRDKHIGQVAHKGEFPWHAALYYTKDITIAYLCGASLISKDHLLTVAHCVVKSQSQTPVNPERLVAYLGKYYLKHWAHEATQTHYISDIVSHPEYNSDTYNNDIAILKLLIPADFSDVVRPVCLWKDSTNYENVANRPGTVVGWGFDETGKIEEKLMYVHMMIQGMDVCNVSVADYKTKFLNSNTYCANFVDDTVECVGDSGGGMVFPTASTKSVWQLRGLVTVSVVLQHQLKCDRSRFVIFTDVAKYHSWIKEAMLQ